MADYLDLFRGPSGRDRLHGLVMATGDLNLHDDVNSLLREQQQTPREEEPDGPAPPNKFIWKGKTATLQPRAWHLVEFLSRQRNQRSQSSTVEDEVWGENEDPSTGAVKAAIRKANKAFVDAGIPLAVSQKNGWLELK